MHIVERRREGFKIVRQARIVVDDVDKVIANVTFLVGVGHLVVAVCRHHGRNVEDELDAPVTPTVGEFTVLIVPGVEAAGVELGTFQAAKGAQVPQEGRIGRRADVVHQDLAFVRLAVANVNHTNFVAVHGRNSIKGGDRATSHVVV